MIFITTGSQKFQFDRLLKKVDELVEQGVIAEPVFAQTGYSDYQPEHYEYKDFLNREEFAQKMGESRIVLTHGGTGAIIGAVKKGKKVIAVPRLAKYGEHVDDHQLQLLKQFEEMNIICSCYDIEQLGDCVKSIEQQEFLTYQSNTQTIIEDMEQFLSAEMKTSSEKVGIRRKLRKYVEFVTTKVKLIVEQKKYTQQGVTFKYMLKERHSDTLIVVLSSCTRKGLKARYNYVRTLKNVAANQLFILDDFGKDHRGGYYIGSDFQFNEEQVAVQLIRQMIEKTNARRLIFCGSSKGGWAALNLGLQFSEANIVVGAPQYFLGDYLVASENFDTLDHILGTRTKEKMERLNYYLCERIQNSPYKENQKIYLHYSNKEHTYEEHVKDLISELGKQGYYMEQDVADYADHSEISYYFPDFLLRNISKIMQN